MCNNNFHNIPKDDFQLLLNSLEDVSYKTESLYLKAVIANLLMQYIIIYHKGNIDSFIDDLMVGDNEFISIGFINNIRSLLNEKEE